MPLNTSVYQLPLVFPIPLSVTEPTVVMKVVKHSFHPMKIMNFAQVSIVLRTHYVAILCARKFYKGTGL